MAGIIILTNAITASELLVGVKLADNEVRRNKRSAFVEHILNFEI